MTAALDGNIKTWKIADIAEAHGELTDLQMRAETQLAEEAALAAIMQGEGNLSIFEEDKVLDQMMQTFRAHDNSIWEMMIRSQPTRDGALVIATASTFNEIKFWKVKHTGGSLATSDVLYDFGHPVQDYIGHGGPVTSTCLFANDTRMVSASEDYNIYLCVVFVVVVCFVVVFFFSSSMTTSSLSLSLGSHFLLFPSLIKNKCNQPLLPLPLPLPFRYDTHSTKVIASWNYNGSVYRIAVDPAEKIVYAGGTNYTICGYSLEHPYNKVVELEGHSGKVVALAISSDGKMMASAAHDFNVNLWSISAEYKNVEHGPEIRYPLCEVLAHSGHVVDLQFSNGLLASCSNDHMVKCWKVSGKTMKAKWECKEAHKTVVSSICWGRGESENVLFSGGWDGEVRAWQEGKLLATMTAHSARVYQLGVTTKGDLMLSAGADLKVFVWNACAPYDLLSVYSPQEDVGMFSSLSVGKDYVLTGEWDGMLRVWPLYDPKKLEDVFVPYTEERSLVPKRTRRPSAAMQKTTFKKQDPKEAERKGQQQQQGQQGQQQQGQQMQQQGQQMQQQGQQMQQQQMQQQQGQQQQGQQQQGQQQQMQQQGQQTVFVTVQCPPDATPGTKLHIQHNGKTYEIAVPANVKPGGTFQFPAAV